MKLQSMQIALTLAALSAGVALADGSSTPPPANSAAPSTAARPMMRRMPDPVAIAQHRLTRLRAALSLTDAQQPAWQTFADKVMAQAHLRQDERKAMENAPDEAPAPQRMAHAAEMMQQHAHSMSDVAAAAQRLYDLLTAEQRKTFDDMAGWRRIHMRARAGNASAPAAAQ